MKHTYVDVYSTIDTADVDVDFVRCRTCSRQAQELLAQHYLFVLIYTFKNQNIPTLMYTTTNLNSSGLCLYSLKFLALLFMTPVPK
jgi:hypothetical protein